MAQQSNPKLNKQEKKRLKKEQARQARAWEKRRKLLVKWSKIAIPAVLLVISVAIVWALQPDTTNAGILRLAKEEHNFGLVSLQGGIVNTTIPIVNIGEGVLRISSMETSCGCTSASIINNGAEGPTFGMKGHGSNPSGWHTDINPGEQALLKIYYNPAVHPDLRGPVTRTITIYSDDPENPTQEVRIKVSQIG